MPHITIQMYPGRDEETKKRLAEKIAKSLNVEMKALFDFGHLLPVEQMKVNIIQNIDKLSDKKISFIYRFFEGYKY